ncbi:MAG TPA: ribosome biogenesis GTPase Der [Polyangiaceae bacterium]|jgi:GTP-binding protein|nr:ribosome biogenesis GTPase Der [Polyangiaceae bacterium]
MKPIVALVGRPNVGKSTIYNRLTRRRSAIVHDEPGVTRDRHYGDVEANGRVFTLVDTGGFDPTSDDPMRQGIKRQIDIAIAEADVIVCVLDALEPATTIDHAEMRLLRAAKKPTIFVANKADNPRTEHEAGDLYRLGIDTLHPISALHGRGVDEVVDAIVEALPPAAPDEARMEQDTSIRVAVVGKPNAGKSSLVNRLLGEERLLVDDRPGTTRDAIDTVVERGGKRYVFVDTAGIRRKAKVKKEADVVEGESVMQSIRAMDRADVVVLVADAHEGVAEQDAKVLGLAVDRGRAAIIALNKADLLDKKELGKAEEDARDKLSFAPWAPHLHISAKTGRGLDRLLAAIDQVGAAFAKRIGTGELNRFFEKVILSHPPPTHGGRAPRLFFITQAETRPPKFVVQASDPEKIHYSYQRYVANQIRKTFAFDGVPIEVIYRKRRRRGDDAT